MSRRLDSRRTDYVILFRAKKSDAAPRCAVHAKGLTYK
jgi:hypothetical protein